MFNALRQGLTKTRDRLLGGFKKLFSGTDYSHVLSDLENLLLQADVGIETCNKITKEITSRLSKNQLQDPKLLYDTLCIVLTDILAPCEKHLPIPPIQSQQPLVLLLVGVNGAGKTTTIGKLANLYQNANQKVVLACGDTFRAAAIEQLAVWGDKLGIPVIKQSIGSDSASVIFDAYTFAVNNQYDILIADTAGRLHNKKNLMDELAKISRVLKKINPQAPHETMLVLDASIGQNSLNQAKTFHETIGITGLTITKLDGTAKAGVIFAIADMLQIPIRYIGVGEGINDLKPFNTKNFISALCDIEQD